MKYRNEFDKCLERDVLGTSRFFDADARGGRDKPDRDSASGFCVLPHLRT